MRRKSSLRVSLVLIGVAALGGCGNEDDQRRDVYASRDDCLADWGNKPEDCKPATEPRHAGHGFFYGPLYPFRSSSSGNTWTNEARRGSRAIGASSAGTRSSPGISRGGFGSSARSSGG